MGVYWNVFIDKTAILVVLFIGTFFLQKCTKKKA